MLFNMFYLLIGFILVSVFMILICFLAYNLGIDREMAGIYECGFNPVLTAHLPYSVRFFKIAVVFLLFDVELVLLMPLIYYFNYFIFMSGMFICLIFLFILIGGLLYEWKQGLLDWVI